jgi:hypothetical protein
MKRQQCDMEIVKTANHCPPTRLQLMQGELTTRLLDCLSVPCSGTQLHPVPMFLARVGVASARGRDTSVL